MVPGTNSKSFYSTDIRVGIYILCNGGSVKQNFVAILLLFFMKRKSSDPSTREDWKFDRCHFYNLDYSQLLIESGGDFDTAYSLAQQNDTAKCHTWSYDKSIYLSTIVTEVSP